MREAVFISKNEKRWREFEKLINEPGKKSDPDLLADLYVKITDDLAFAQTQYPGSRSHKYLNALASKVHHAIYRNKKEKSNRFITFWKRELPLVFYESRKQLLYSLLIFGVSALLGVLSTAFDDTYSRLILSDAYVNMTIENIEKGDPMAVYKDADSAAMFLGITLNNIYVALLTFVMGIFFSFGTAFILFRNGVMVGTFQYFFVQKGLFWTSFLSIWIHGAIEISSIVVAGAAGLVMGNSLLFPGTYSRLHSLKQGARKGLKIMVGLVPLFIFAAFLESFITRLTDWHWSARLAIILLSFAFIIYYVVIYPVIVNKKYGKNQLSTTEGFLTEDQRDV